MNATDQLADRITGLTVNVLRFAEHLKGRVFQDLLDLEEELVIDLQKALGRKATAFTIARLNALLRQTRDTIATAYGGIAMDTKKAADELATIVAARSVAIVESVIGADVMSVALTSEQISKIARDFAVFGHLPNQWWKAQDTRLRDAFAREMRMGQYRGESIDDLIRRVRGTKAMGYTDGVMQASKHQAEALVRTSVMTVAGLTNQAVYDSNRDVIKGIQWVSTLDSRTTEICMALDGKRWDFPQKGASYADYIPVGHNKEFSPPPAHWNCRSVIVPITFSWEELAALHGNAKAAKKAEDIPAGKRAAMDGEVAASMNYEGWLQNQPESFQNEVLGPARAKLWREGKIKLSQLTDIRNNPLTLAQLREAAGLPKIEPPAPRPTPAPAPAPKPAPEGSSRQTILGSGVTNELEDNTGSHTSELKRLVLQDGSVGYFKPLSGEEEGLRAGRISGEYYKREAAAYDVAEIIGLDDLVPVTIVREYKGEIGSIQDGVKDAKIGAKFASNERFDGDKDAARAAAFDYFIGNTDRHAGNWMLTKAGKIQLIDNGLTFPHARGWGNRDIIFHAYTQEMPIPAEVADWLTHWGEIEALLRKANFTDLEISGAEERLRALAKVLDGDENTFRKLPPP